MDNFYRAFASGAIKMTSVMNYIQHLMIAEHCKPGDWVLDVCCGRSLQIPILKHIVPDLGGYIGMDISEENLREAAEVIRSGDGCPPAFPCDYVCGDVTRDLTQLSHRLFDSVVYTSALEHMPKEDGIASLQQVHQVLHPEGTFFLSTPRTSGPTPKKLQHRVHVYEWDRTEVEEELSRIGFTITSCYGLLPPATEFLAAALTKRYGEGAALWFEVLQQSIPMPFLGPVCAAALPDLATELLYVCRRHRQ
jgi:ubiquinone/menaquinone biosynthesis C-methylase UbiE